MRRHRHDDEVFDKRGLLRDGARLRVPLTMMDSMDPIQRGGAQSSLRVTDGSGGTVGLHRPGFRIPAADAADARKRRNAHGEEEEENQTIARPTSDARMQAYAAYERYVNDAWKNPAGFGGAPNITGFNERGSVGRRESGTGMLDYEENAEDIVRNAATHTESARCHDHRTIEQMMCDHQNKMTNIYDKFDHELSETWRRS